MSSVNIAQMEIKEGQRGKGVIPVATLANGSLVNLPLMIANGSEDGPLVWLNAALHGNELNGVLICFKIFQEINLEKFRGSIVFTPIANPLAFQSGQRISNVDGLNLGECFPGKSEGQITERIAANLFREIRQHANYVIDIHAAGQGHSAKPYAVYKVSGNEQVDMQTEQMVKWFGVNLVCKLSLEGALDEPSPLGGSLDVCCTRSGIPSFMAELGHAGRVEEDIVEFGTNRIVNILKGLGMLAEKPEEFANPITLTERQIIRCKNSGLAFVDLKPHGFAEKNSIIARIVNIYGETVEEIKAPKDIYGISLRYQPVVNVGDRVAFVGSCGN